ncbi:uncharacterized protein MYCFIDRAFT_211338 [Pseudocercospora fijiensis CIRAD86]|uniref:D-3-phosphoglycerate dehydrogenase n=1 Tax=Pseudocercospora fijiensis (strain CIRAD86) TaxID=383855 RepID=M3B1Z2_PSEFD|nr:uncharacterized protein MYCFIDRAFT_211338 [Pseudocercospora fijiensis CIRAD86]EME83432.1 hypothetical protein MYCFIDRAFT_211338 [Pseudocercospora fijiensis CIRAD86]
MESIQEPPAVYVIDPYHSSALAELKRHQDIRLVLPNDPAKSEWPRDATAVLVRSETRIDAASVEKAGPQLKYIVKQGVGVDNISLEDCTAKGIKVYNTPGLNSEAVAELTLSLAFCIARRVAEVDRKIRSGEEVVRSLTLGKSLFKKTIGIVGMGNIGVEVARKWIGCTGGSVVAFDPYAEEGAWSNDMPAASFQRVSQLDEVLESSDVITLHVPLTSSTENLISASALAKVKRGAILLNCARGGIVDESALLDALNSGKLFGAGLDAMLHEPPTWRHYGETLLSHPRVVMTPHIGASTEETQETSGVYAVNIALGLLRGDSSDMPKPLN